MEQDLYYKELAREFVEVHPFEIFYINNSALQLKLQSFFQSLSTQARVLQYIFEYWNTYKTSLPKMGDHCRFWHPGRKEFFHGVVIQVRLIMEVNTKKNCPGCVVRYQHGDVTIKLSDMHLGVEPTQPLKMHYD